MNIAMINCGLVGSTGRIMQQIADCAAERGHKVSLIVSGLPVNKTVTTKHTVFYISGEFSRKVSVFLGRMTGRTNCFAYFSTKRLLNYFENFKPEIIHLHNLHESFINLNLLFSYIKKNNIRVVWTLHDCWSFTGHCAKFPGIVCEKWKTGCKECPQLKEYPKSYFFDNSISMYLRKKKWFSGVECMTLVTPSEWLKGLVEDSFLNQYEVKVINNGIDLSVFKPTESDFRKKYGIPKEKIIVLGVKFAWNKAVGYDIFLKLPKLLGEKYQIVMVGDTSDITSEIPDSIITIPRTNSAEELAKIYTAADLFLNPARDDNYPTVNMEAIACGTPVITSDVGGCPETVLEGCGEIVSVDAELIAKAIGEISGKDVFSQENCRVSAEKFDKQKNFKAYVDLFEK